MHAICTIEGLNYRANLEKPVDISIPLRDGSSQVNCFYAPLYETAPVVAGSFVGSTAQGGAVNFFNVRLNPHGNGTHTECVGHISKERHSIQNCLKQFHFPAQLISVYPQRLENGDRVVTAAQLKELYARVPASALVLRTMPNNPDKLTRNYSGTNPPYLEPAALAWMAERGIQHLLLDLPSVDREEDGGALAGHRAFWQYPDTLRKNRLPCTITELIFVPAEVPDGLYLLNLQIASFELDVSPSKPVLYPLEPVNE
jgi:arylformamidase